MSSFPNLIPLDQATFLEIARWVGRCTIDRVYGGWWGRVVVDDGAAATAALPDASTANDHHRKPGDPGSRSALRRTSISYDGIEGAYESLMTVITLDFAGGQIMA
jgi:hypothetical protein